jgi:hypothetical protein
MLDSVQMDVICTVAEFIAKEHVLPTPILSQLLNSFAQGSCVSSLLTTVGKR